MDYRQLNQNQQNFCNIKNLLNDKSKKKSFNLFFITSHNILIFYENSQRNILEKRLNDPNGEMLL